MIYICDYIYGIKYYTCTKHNLSIFVGSFHKTSVSHVEQLKVETYFSLL